MIQDHLYPRLCNGANTPSLPGKPCVPLCNARCRLMCEGTKPVPEHTSQDQHLTLIWRCLMTQGIKKTESFVTTGWQFWDFVPLEQSDINTVYWERDWHLWWIDLIQWNEIPQETMTILHLSRFLLQLQGFSLYLACFNENICKISMEVILIYKDETGHTLLFQARVSEQNESRLICSAWWPTIKCSHPTVMNVYQKICMLEETTSEQKKDKIIAMRCEAVWNILGHKNVWIHALLSSYFKT